MRQCFTAALRTCATSIKSDRNLQLECVPPALALTATNHALRGGVTRNRASLTAAISEWEWRCECSSSGVSWLSCGLDLETTSCRYSYWCRRGQADQWLTRVHGNAAPPTTCGGCALMIQPVMIGGGISRCENNSFCPCGPVLMSLQKTARWQILEVAAVEVGQPIEFVLTTNGRLMGAVWNRLLSRRVRERRVAE